MTVVVDGGFVVVLRLFAAALVAEGVLLLVPLDFLLEKQLPISPKLNKTPNFSSDSLRDQKIQNYQIAQENLRNDCMQRLNFCLFF